MNTLPEVGETIVERYRIEAILGHGATGAVFQALDAATGRRVALKWLSPAFIESADAVTRFIAEARATAKIDHPNVIVVHDVGRVGQAPFLVMELLRGESLGKRLDRGRLRVREVLDLLIPICDGVADAHAEGVIHRDLKPDNIFLCAPRDGRAMPPKVVDFGVAKLRGASIGVTQTGASLGTPLYMAPEQIGSAREADERADVYSLGIVLYESLTGRLPYDADDAVVLVRKIVEAAAPSVSALVPGAPPELSAIVARAMHRDRDARFASVLELRADLARVRDALKAGLPARRAAPLARADSTRERPSDRAPSIPKTQPGLPRAAPPRNMLRLFLAAFIGGAIVLLLAGGAAALLLPSLLSPPAHRPAPPRVETSHQPPLQPELSSAGSSTLVSDCGARFDGALRTMSHGGDELIITSLIHGEESGRIHIVMLAGMVQGANQLRLGAVRVTLTDARGGVYTNRPSELEGDYRVEGTIAIHAWMPSRGRADIAFENAVLADPGSLATCVIRGRIDTDHLDGTF